MDEIPLYVSFVFVATTITTTLFVYYAIRATESKRSRLASTITLGSILIWMGVTYVLAQTGFYRVYDALPPRAIFALVPPNLAIIIVIIIKRTREYMLRIPISILTYLHIIRVPIEMVLWWLAIQGVAPYLITFEGVNYDILSGVTAPFIAVFLLGIRSQNRIGTTIWNLATLALLVNVVFHALLSAPTPFQIFSFDQPLTAVFYAPYIWLPAVVVPIVFWSHLVALIQLLSKTS